MKNSAEPTIPKQIRKQLIEQTADEMVRRHDTHRIPFERRKITRKKKTEPDTPVPVVSPLDKLVFRTHPENLDALRRKPDKS